MPRTTRARDEKREQILTGAIEAFARKGFHRTTVSDVAKAAGVADGTIYLYFRNKNELLETIFESTLAAFMEQSRDYLLQDEDAMGQLDRLVELHLGLLGRNRAVASVFQIDLRHSQHFLGEVSRRVLRPYLEAIGDIVRRGQERGVFASVPAAEAAAHMVFGVLDQLATNWVLSRRNYRLESQVGETQAFLRRALGA